MKRFDFEGENDDEEFFEDEDDEDGEGKAMSPREYRELLDEEQMIQQESVELAYISLNQELIGKAISLCKNSFWWKFCTLDTQIGMISKVYDKLKKLQDS
jgi:hypothetical protein